MIKRILLIGLLVAGHVQAEDINTYYACLAATATEIDDGIQSLDTLAPIITDACYPILLQIPSMKDNGTATKDSAGEYFSNKAKEYVLRHRALLRKKAG